MPPNNFFVRRVRWYFCKKPILLRRQKHYGKTHWSGLVFMSHGTSTSNSRGSCILIHKWVSFELHRCIRDPYGRFVIIGTLCGYAIHSPADIQWEVSGCRTNYRSTPAADFPRDVCLTLSRKHKVFLLSSTNISSNKNNDALKWQNKMSFVWNDNLTCTW